jgi:hypothetical protein
VDSLVDVSEENSQNAIAESLKERRKFNPIREKHMLIHPGGSQTDGRVVQEDTALVATGEEIFLKGVELLTTYLPCSF